MQFGTSNNLCNHFGRRLNWVCDCQMQIFHRHCCRRRPWVNIIGFWANILFSVQLVKIWKSYVKCWRSRMSIKGKAAKQRWWKFFKKQQRPSVLLCLQFGQQTVDGLKLSVKVSGNCLKQNNFIVDWLMVIMLILSNPLNQLVICQPPTRSHANGKFLMTLVAFSAENVWVADVAHVLYFDNGNRLLSPLHLLENDFSLSTRAPVAFGNISLEDQTRSTFERWMMLKEFKLVSLLNH